MSARRIEAALGRVEEKLDQILDWINEAEEILELEDPAVKLDTLPEVVEGESGPEVEK